MLCFLQHSKKVSRLLAALFSFGVAVAAGRHLVCLDSADSLASGG
jgi:hypothetical protein